MKMKQVFFICAAAVVFAGCTNKKNQIPTNGEAVPFAYTVMNMMDFPYQSFVKNWNNEKYPILCSIIKNNAEFETIFGAAATMNNKKPFTPSEEDFSKYQYVVISKVTIPPVEGFSFKVDSVDYKENHLSVYYTFTEPKEDAGYNIKDGFMLQLPRTPIDSVTVYENMKVVAEIK